MFWATRVWDLTNWLHVENPTPQLYLLRDGLRNLRLNFWRIYIYMLIGNEDQMALGDRSYGNHDECTWQYGCVILC